MPSKELSFRRKYHKDGFGKAAAAEQKRGRKEGSASSAFAHLGNAMAIVIAELSRSENNMTSKTLKADDILELLEAALDPMNLILCGSHHPYLVEFKATFKNTFAMLKNVNCAHLKLLEKRTGTFDQGHFVNEMNDARDDVHNQTLKNKALDEELENSTIEEQYYSCDDDALDAFDSKVESSNATGSSRLMERTQNHRSNTDVGKLRASNHDLIDMLFFPRFSESENSESDVQAKTHSDDCMSSDRNDSSDCRIKDVRLVRCTVDKGQGTVYRKDKSFCNIKAENLHEQTSSSSLHHLEDAARIAKFVGDEAESSLASEKRTVIEARSPSTSIQGDHADLPWQNLGDETTPFTPMNGFDGIKKAMELVQRPISTFAKLDESVVQAGRNRDSHITADSNWRQALLDALERSVEVQKHHNYIKSVELAHLFKRLSVEEVQLHLASESNDLMKQNVALSRSKVNFKLWKTFDKKMETAFMELNRTCADELIAGLFVMLTALLYGAWKFSYNRLTEVVQYCQQSEPEVKGTHRWRWFEATWYSGPLASFSRRFQALTCHITVLGRMVVGLAIIAFVSSSLLRHTVTSSSQAMPVTILLVVLGGICGFAGKWSVQSLGGSGLYWLLLWETICALHLFATCFTPTLYYLLNGVRADGQKSRSHRWVAPWIRQSIFHLTLVLLLPTMAGLVPFAAFREVVQTLSIACFDKSTTLLQSFVIT